MKRFSVIFIAAIIIISTLSLPTAFASDARLTFSGETDVEPGQTYTYTYKLSYTDACQGFVEIHADGIFENLQGNKAPFFENSAFVNITGVVEGTIKVSVKSSAKPGDTGTLSISGTYIYKQGDNFPTVPIGCSPFRASVPLPKATPAPSLSPTPSKSPTPPPVPVPQVTPMPDDSPAPSEQPTQSPVSAAAPKETKIAQPLLELTPPSQAPSPTPNPTETPAPTPSAYNAEWLQLGAQLDTLPAGGALRMTAPESKMIPYTLLKALKAKQCTLELSLGDYICIIRGDELFHLPDGADALSLDMSMLTDPALSDAADGFDIYQLHFSHNGELPGRFVYRFKAAHNNPGDEVYLYYYSNMSGKVEYKQAAVVDENGYVSFDIYSCSSYFVTGSPIGDSIVANVLDDAGIPLAPPKDNTTLWMILIPIFCIVLVSSIVFIRLRRVGPFKKKTSYKKSS